MRFFLVGGCVRDELLGIKSKDIDIAVEGAGSWEEFRAEIHRRHTTIFKEEPEYFRIKALGQNEGLKGPLDYTMTRSDGFYTDGRRPDDVQMCDLAGDLGRRDFTVNAMARCIETGELFDPFDGQTDLKYKHLRCVGDTKTRMEEDGLRWFRAFRFNIMKDFALHKDLYAVMREMMKDPDKWFKNTSTDRVRSELRRCFHHSNTLTFLAISKFNDTNMLEFFESRGLWFNPTTQEKAGNGE